MGGDKEDIAGKLTRIHKQAGEWDAETIESKCESMNVRIKCEQWEFTTITAAQFTEHEKIHIKVVICPTDLLVTGVSKVGRNYCS